MLCFYSEHVVNEVWIGLIIKSSKNLKYVIPQWGLFKCIVIMKFKLKKKTTTVSITSYIPKLVLGKKCPVQKKLEKEYNKGNEKDLDSEAGRKLQTLWDN